MRHGLGGRRRHAGFIPSSTIGKAPDVVPCRAHLPLRGREIDVHDSTTVVGKVPHSSQCGCFHVHVPFMGPESYPSGIAHWPPQPYSHSTIAVSCPILAPPPTSAISLINHPPSSIVRRPSMHKADAQASYRFREFPWCWKTVPAATEDARLSVESIERTQAEQGGGTTRATGGNAYDGAQQQECRSRGRRYGHTRSPRACKFFGKTNTAPARQSSSAGAHFGSAGSFPCLN
jgi:hypothetical protein